MPKAFNLLADIIFSNNINNLSLKFNKLIILFIKFISNFYFLISRKREKRKGNKYLYLNSRIIVCALAKHTHTHTHPTNGHFVEIEERRPMGSAAELSQAATGSELLAQARSFRECRSCAPLATWPPEPSASVASHKRKECTCKSKHTLNYGPSREE